MNPILTVGVPVFNEEPFISDTLHSLSNQSFKNWIAIVSDNCSTDNSYKIVQDIASKDSRISNLKQDIKISMIDNFIFTLNSSKTKYFVWLGGHDIFCERYFEAAIDILEKESDIALVYPKSLFIDKSGVETCLADSEINSGKLNRCARMSKILKNLILCTPLHGIFRREILCKLPLKSIIGADHLLLFSAASYGKLFQLPFVGIKRRTVRNESFEDKKKRWIKEGVFIPSIGSNPYEGLKKEHLKFILESSHIAFYEKVYLYFQIQNIFKKRFNT